MKIQRAGIGKRVASPPVKAAKAAVADARRDALRFASRFDPATTPYPSTKREMARATRAVQQTLSQVLPTLSPSQRKAIGLIRGVGVSDVDLFHGSHVVVSDKGGLYQQLEGLGATPRVSSHYPGVATQQYQIDLGDLGAILFGKDAQGSSWFQVEAHSARGIDALAHVGDFLLHVTTGDMNVGPLGVSPCSEKRGTEIRVSAPPA